MQMSSSESADEELESLEARLRDEGTVGTVSAEELLTINIYRRDVNALEKSCARKELKNVPSLG